MKEWMQKLLPFRGSESRSSALGSSSNSDSTTAPGTLLPVPGSESQRQAITGASSSSLSSPGSGPYGLAMLCEGTEPVVDIVAVHGLNGHRETTWTDEGGVLWLRDLLPLRAPNMRVWTWGYDSRTHSKSHHDHLTIKTLYDHGRELVQDLDTERRQDGSYQRPIIFVAHSLGGIVIKSALLHSDRMRPGHLENERSIKLSTYGIIFMGTPHQGGQGVKMGEILLNVAKVRGNTNNRVLKHLVEHSELLQTQISEFTAISQDFDITFVYETLPTPIVGAKTKVIVPKWSAVVPGTPDAAEFGISQNHTQMTKLSSSEHQDFKKLSRVLVSMTQKANVKIESNWHSEARIKQGRQAYDVPFNIRGVPIVGKYVERLREMQTMEGILSPGAENKQRRIFVLHGLGGIGKTQLALAYARKYQHIYTAVFWLNGQTRESLEQSLAGLASQLPKDQISDCVKRCAQEGNEHLGKVVHEVKSWFSRDGNCNWLLLYDNVDRDISETSDDPEAFDVREYLPECDQGSIIITTRQHRLRTLGDEMRLAEMTAEEGLELLASRIGKSLIDNPQAYEFVARVGSLPLALAQAASYMRETNTSITEYLRFYNTAWDDLMAHEARPESTLSEYGNRSVQTTWTISFEGVRRKNEDAAKMLQVWSYLDNRDIWFEIFNNKTNSDLEYWSNPPEWFRRAVRNKLSFKEVAATLLAYSLIEARQDSESYGVHPVVHEWCRKTVTSDEQHELAFLAITSVAFGVPHRDERDSWLNWRRLLQHANRFSQQLMDMLEEALESEQANELHHAFRKLGRLYQGGGARMWVEAEATYCRAISGHEKLLGLYHDRTLSTLLSLGTLYHDQERLVDAEALNRRVLASQTEKLGLDHTATMGTMFNLAVVLSRSNKLAEAETLYQPLLMRSQMDLNFDKNLVFAALGSLYQKQGKLVESEAMCLQAIAGYKTYLETDHPDILRVRYGLGFLYYREDKLVEAETTTQQVLEGLKKVLGLDHEETLQAMYLLGHIFKKQGRLAEAEAVCQQALMECLKVQSPGHALILAMSRDLRLLHELPVRLPDAETINLAVAELLKHVLNPRDKKTELFFDFSHYIARIYIDQGRFKEAEIRFQEALAGYRTILSPKHESNLSALWNLGKCCQDQGKFVKAESLWLQGLELFGPDEQKNENVFKLKLGLAFGYREQKKLVEAEAVYHEALNGYQTMLGLRHESTLRILSNLVGCYLEQGKYAEAELLLLQELESSKQIPDDQKTSTEFGFIYNLGYIYLNLGRLAEAEAMFQQALSGYRCVLGSEHKSTLNAIQYLRKCYESQGMFAEAAALSPEDTDLQRIHGHIATTNI